MSTTEAIYTWATFRTLDAQPAGGTIKSTAGQVGGWYLSNNAASVRYLKLYNKAAPTSSDTPQLTILIPANSAANLMTVAGIDFTTAIGYRVTTGIADNDTGAPTANDVVVNIFYR